MYIAVQKFPEGYAVLTINKEPVNALDLSLWQELEDNIKQLEADPKSLSDPDGDFVQPSWT